MALKDDPKYKLVFKHHAADFYMPDQITDYHKLREMAMQAQDVYSRCGVSREVLDSFTNKMLEIANTQGNVGTMRTDIGIIANNLKYRMSNIVDEQCILRMAAIGLFIEGENPDEVHESWTNRKMALADKYPDIRAFFLQMGVAFTPEYATILRGLAIEEYLTERQIVLNGLTLPSTPPSS